VVERWCGNTKFSESSRLRSSSVRQAVLDSFLNIGVLTSEGNLKRAKREVLMQLILANCAGKAAMDRCYGYKAKSDENWRASSDFKAALSYAILLNNGDEKGAELLLAWLERRAELLVERKWPQIHKLAFTLLENEKLSGTEIYEILIRNAETCPTMINKQLR
jgi:hypothetical protein